MSILSDENLLERIEIDAKQTIEANQLKKIFNIPFGDALHAILARDNHFDNLTKIAIVKKPEELI